MSKKHLWLLGALLLLLSACGNASPSTVELSEADAGQQVELKEGDTLQVQLPGNPSTGYAWEVGPQGITCLELEGEPAFAADSDALGAPGTVTLRFTAVEPGEETLRLIYHRPWETDVEPEDSFEVAVVVE